jgi:hypothetical protein
MRIWTWAVVGAAGCACAVTLPMVFGGCSSSSTPPPPSAGGGGACSTEAGAFPTPNCDDTPESCTAPSPACPTTPCNSSSPCLAMADNSGQSDDGLRLRKLNVVAPPALAQHFIQAGVIDQGVNLHYYCGEGGDGSFSWIMQFNPSTGQLTTGGAPITSDPFNVGYCFVNATIGGIVVQPITTTMTKGSDGSWASTVIPKLYVPIYVNGLSTDVVVLPLSQASIKGVTLSPDGNCIGSYNPSGVTSALTTMLDGMTDESCDDEDYTSCQRWHTAGSLGGYITLKESDGVFVQDLGKSLCVLLTGGTSTTNSGMNCQTDSMGNIVAKGDFCSTTDAPGGCQDSYWLAATFAASAAKITTGSDVATCNGSMLDAGVADTGGGG